MRKRELLVALGIAFIIVLLGVSNFRKTTELSDLSKTNDCARSISGEINQKFQINVGILLYDNIRIRETNDINEQLALRAEIRKAAKALSEAPDSGELILKQCK